MLSNFFKLFLVNTIVDKYYYWLILQEFILIIKRKLSIHFFRYTYLNVVIIYYLIAERLITRYSVNRSGSLGSAPSSTQQISVASFDVCQLKKKEHVTIPSKDKEREREKERVEALHRERLLPSGKFDRKHDRPSFPSH